MAAAQGAPDPAPEELDPATTPAVLLELRAIRTEMHEGRTLTRQLIGVLMDLRDELAHVRRASERTERATQLVEGLEEAIRKRSDSEQPVAVARTKTGG